MDKTEPMPMNFVRLPKRLIAEMDAAIEARAYRTRSEFIRAAIREKLAREGAT